MRGARTSEKTGEALPFNRISGSLFFNKNEAVLARMARA